jgi:hypothetical protein
MVLKVALTNYFDVTSNLLGRGVRALD